MAPAPIIGPSRLNSTATRAIIWLYSIDMIGLCAAAQIFIWGGRSALQQSVRAHPGLPGGAGCTKAAPCWRLRHWQPLRPVVQQSVYPEGAAVAAAPLLPLDNRYARVALILVLTTLACQSAPVNHGIPMNALGGCFAIWNDARC